MDELKEWYKRQDGDRCIDQAVKSMTADMVEADMIKRQKAINDAHDKIIELSPAEYSVKPQ